MTLLALLSIVFATPAFAGPGDSPRPQFGASESLTPEEEAALLEQIALRDPERAEKLPMLKARDPGRYYEMLGRVSRMMEREDRDPEARARHERIQGVRHEIKALAIEYRAADPGDQKKLLKELEKLAGQMFDLRQDERRNRLEELKSRLAEAEAEFAEQDDKRAEVIAEHLDKLLER